VEGETEVEMKQSKPPSCLIPPFTNLSGWPSEQLMSIPPPHLNVSRSTASSTSLPRSATFAGGCLDWTLKDLAKARKTPTMDPGTPAVDARQRHRRPVRPVQDQLQA
jgi:hypothetical protein